MVSISEDLLDLECIRTTQNLEYTGLPKTKVDLYLASLKLGLNQIKSHRIKDTGL